MIGLIMLCIVFVMVTIPVICMFLYLTWDTFATIYKDSKVMFFIISGIMLFFIAGTILFIFGI